jgi:hypothetical protein
VDDRVVDEEVNEEAAAALEEDGGVAILCGWFGWIFSVCICRPDSVELARDVCKWFFLFENV